MTGSFFVASSHPYAIGLQVPARKRGPSIALCKDNKALHIYGGVRDRLYENFFAALKKKLLEKNEFQRHGMVLFDEMQVRKAKYLSSKTMSYVGLSGNGDSATS